VVCSGLTCERRCDLLRPLILRLQLLAFSVLKELHRFQVVGVHVSRDYTMSLLWHYCQQFCKTAPSYFDEALYYW
jgi:hypothetical protein